MSLATALEQLYAAFHSYSPANMHYCQCGCIDPEEVKQLASKSLQQLTVDDLSSYQGSALYTWGEVEHYKHFLPRILAVCQQEAGRGLIDLEAIAIKLDYAHWRTWPAKEIEVIEAFLWEAWLVFINKTLIAVEQQDLDVYSFFFPLELLLNAWETIPNSKGMSNFVDFFYKNGNTLLQQGLRIRGNTHQAVFQDFIQQAQLLGQLEQEFFQQEATAPEYAEKVAVVAQIIEQEKAA